MSLDLSRTAVQVDGMAVHLKNRQSDRLQRLQRGLRAVEDFSLEAYNVKWAQERASEGWEAPRVLEAPDSRHAPPPTPSDFCVAATDGSHIDVDRHLPVRCFLINTGVSVLTYGSAPDARLFSRPRLYARDDELVIRDGASYREQLIQGAVLGAKRTVEEMRALVEVVRDLPQGTPTLALLDGSMVMLGLVGHGFHDFVPRELIEEGFVAALEDLKALAADRPLSVASYVSLPGSTEAMNALRLTVCPYGLSDAGGRCGLPGPGRQPCDGCVGGVLDRELFWELLEPGQRSALFASSSRVVENHYRGHGVSFFYVNAGEEIGRVEVPSWVADDDGLLGFTHSLVVDQCRRGRGYPVALMEAHEQAVVSGADRRFFEQFVGQALNGQDLPVYSSEKARSKRLRWL